MLSQDLLDRRYALAVARWVLGLQFLMAGIFKVFSMGAVQHAQRLFVDGYADTWLPTPLLWALGISIPFIELIAGALLCLGLCRRPALLAVGAILIVVTFGHLMKDPFYVVSEHVLPRLAILAFLFYGPLSADTLSVDAVIARRKQA